MNKNQKDFIFSISVVAYYLTLLLLALFDHMILFAICASFMLIVIAIGHYFELWR